MAARPHSEGYSGRRHETTSFEASTHGQIGGRPLPAYRRRVCRSIFDEEMSPSTRYSFRVWRK